MLPCWFAQLMLPYKMWTNSTAWTHMKNCSWLIACSRFQRVSAQLPHLVQHQQQELARGSPAQVDCEKVGSTQGPSSFAGTDGNKRAAGSLTANQPDADVQQALRRTTPMQNCSHAAVGAAKQAAALSINVDATGAAATCGPTAQKTALSQLSPRQQQRAQAAWDKQASKSLARQQQRKKTIADAPCMVSISNISHQLHSQGRFTDLLECTVYSRTASRL